MSTPKRLETLTADQAAILPIVRDEWLAHGLSCEPADRERAVRGVAMAYGAAMLEPPRVVVWLDSPLAGAIGTAMLRQVGDQVGDQVEAQVRDQVRAQVGDQVWDQVGDQVGDQVWAQVWAQVGDQVGDHVRDHVRDQVWAQVRDQVWDQVGDQVGDQVWDQVWAQVGDQVGDHVGAQVWDQVRAQVGDQVRRAIWGQHEANWLAFYAAMGRCGLTDLVAPLDGLSTVARSTGWWWALRGAAVLTDRPAELHRDDQGRLHHDGGPALAYRDGFSIHAWHGIRVPSWIVTDDLTVEQATSLRNAEHRRCAIERLGWDRLTDRLHLAAVAPDPGNPGQQLALYDVPDGVWGERVRVLLVTNGTVERDGTRRRYGLTVPADMPDPVTAAAWTYRMNRDDYAALARRT